MYEDLGYWAISGPSRVLTGCTCGGGATGSLCGANARIPVNHPLDGCAWQKLVLRKRQVSGYGVLESIFTVLMVGEGEGHGGWGSEHKPRASRSILSSLSQ